MSAKLGLPAAIVACLILVATPAFADDGTSPTSTAVTTTVVESPDPTTTLPVDDTTVDDTTVPAADASTTTSTPTSTPITTSTTTNPAPAIAAASPATSSPTPWLSGGAEALASPGPLGPARASGATPTRGDQLQIIEPPADPTAEAFVPPEDTGSGRRVVYSKSKQTVWVYDESNTIIKMHRVSGKQDPYDPAPGVYSVYSRSIRTYAIHNPSITWSYMVRFAHGARGGNIGFHEIPYQFGRPVQTTDQLGSALSGGCVRQTTEDAIWMWNWAQVGTTVVVKA